MKWYAKELGFEEEADKVSSRIAEILSETGFSFSPNEYIRTCKKVFMKQQSILKYFSGIYF